MVDFASPASPLPSLGAAAAKFATAAPVIIANNGINHEETSSGGTVQYSDMRDEFYASIFPVCYALAATTVTAYMLVIMLFITPRSFLDGGIVYLGRRGFTSGATSNGISIGGRPWLQKVAAVTVAISLTIASADTFKVAEEQYLWSIQDAKKLQLEVMEGTELKVIRLISDTFLWLAQAQTLTRLFPRQREKVIIKWTAFALITLNLIFSALNSFQFPASGSQGNARPRSFVDAVPALSYLFQLSLGLLYAAWVIYYSLMKKRYAFYHPLMKNMILVSTLSLFAILVPVVFFVLDMAQPEFTGWGDYVRWVGAAAASVIVWEWVERIEALEREEKKDGILGREIFDGDEMLEVSASEFPWLRRRKNRGGPRDGEGGQDGPEGGGTGAQGPPSGGRGNLWPGMTSIANRYRGNHNNQNNSTANNAQNGQKSIGGLLRPPMLPLRPAPAVTPVSRTDTASAASTVYAVRYQLPSETTSRTPEAAAQRPNQISPQRNAAAPMSRSSSTSSRSDSSSDNDAASLAAPVPRQATHKAVEIDTEAQEDPNMQNRKGWRSLVGKPFFRLNARDPPAEVMAHTEPKPEVRGGHDDAGRWDFKARLEDFAATQAEKIREKMRPTPETDSLPVTVIPAPPRQGAALAQLLEEERTGGQEAPERAGLTRTASDASALTPTTGVALAAHPTGALGRTTSNFSHLSRGVSQTDEPATTQLNRPPLWPGVRAQPQEYDQLSPIVPQGRRPADDLGPPPNA
ncbi:ph-response regulator protein palh rim21 [Colletotrichum truncatum]|uniref:Ph-response regulator protein palh rim21 n=1 Tax=Colletotrichum truncatum TaxID=5467 RepID=A0ACC3YGL1_COLTU|nr:ph-response regulator protein palh rim21 [Colletotrichum truncatum]KAF6781898.1 ph-response regulator protein palh rim21 [Colletotrichum truncatum]